MSSSRVDLLCPIGRKASIWSIRVLLPTLTLITTVSLLVVLGFQASSALAVRAVAQQIPLFVDASNDLFSAIQDIRLERGNVNRALSASQAATSATLENITHLRTQSARWRRRFQNWRSLTTPRFLKPSLPSERYTPSSSLSELKLTQH